MSISLLIAALRNVRKVHRLAHATHHHVVAGHCLELGGALLAIAKMEMLANGMLLGGVALLLFHSLNEGK